MASKRNTNYRGISIISRSHPGFSSAQADEAPWQTYMLCRATEVPLNMNTSHLHIFSCETQLQDKVYESFVTKCYLIFS